MQVAGKVVVVTGGANGIGQALCEVFHRAGAAKVVSQAFQQGRHGHGGWNELHTTDWKAAFDFYAKHFGWGKSMEMDMGPHGIYLLFNTGGDAIGGMMNSPNFPRPAWLYYICVSDIDAAHARIEANGGKVVLPPTQVPGGGWIDTDMSKIAPCLWFNGEAEEAARFYVSLFTDGEITSVSHFGPGMHFPDRN
eukprot:gene4335-5921_t